jgi:PleD family two-component response regulator
MILCAVQDLMFVSKLRSAAAQSGVELRFVRAPSALLAEARERAPALVVLDLNADALQPLAMVAALRGDAALAATRIVGFVSHVDAARIDAARTAGVDEILARSAFVSRLPALLRDKD